MFRYNATTTPLLWSDFVVERKKVFVCNNLEEPAFPFYIQVGLLYLYPGRTAVFISRY